MGQNYDADEFDGPTFNNYPVVARESDLRVRCLRGTDRVHESIRNDCTWAGPVAETTPGQPPIGSKPVALCCPDCGYNVAFEANTTSAGYWDGKL